jgi:hypothetical protein
MPLPRSNAEILAAHMDAIMADIRKCLPGTVTAVNTTRQTVDVQLAVNGVLFDELGTAISVPAASLSDVPLGVMRGGGFLVWVPVAVGDSVLVLFSDYSTDTWRDTCTGPAVDPGWVGVHTADSPFAIPCVTPDAGFLTSTPGDKVVVGKDNADEQILIGASDILLGRSAVDPVALATKLDSLINILAPLVPYPPGPTSGSALVAALATWQLANWPAASTVGATLVKAQ